MSRRALRNAERVEPATAGFPSDSSAGRAAPPAVPVAATVSASGVQALTPGVFRVRIGDVERTGNFVEGTVELRGSQPAVLMDMPALRAAAKAKGVVGA